MRKHILLAVYIAIIIGALSGITEASVVILMGKNVIRRQYLLWITSFYLIIWGIGGSILGFITYYFFKWFNKKISYEKLSLFYISAISFFSIFVIGGLYFNCNRYYTKEFFTLKSILSNICFIIGVYLISFLIYKILKYSKKNKIFNAFTEKLAYKSIKIIIIISLLLIVAFISFYPSSSTEIRPIKSIKKPSLNIIFLLVDALRADHLSCYGYSKNTSPNIDQIAKEGILFSNAFANSSWTKPTTATIFSSLYLSSHNVNNVSTGLSEEATILFEPIKKYGYSTGIFSSNNFVAPLYGFDQGVDYFYTFKPSITLRLSIGLIIRKIGTLNSYTYKVYNIFRKLEQLILSRHIVDITADGLNRCFLDWIDSLNGERFFAYIHYMEVHGPYTPPPPYDKMFFPSSKVSLLKPALKIRPVRSAFEHMPETMSFEEKREFLISQYDGEIRWLDASIGKLIEQLKKKNILDETLIIITADHGEEFFEHSNWGHSSRNLFDELIHIPLIMRYPKKLPPGAKIDALIQQVDLMPTIFDFCDIPLSSCKMSQGHSIIPLFKENEKNYINKFVISESYKASENNLRRSIRNQKNKLILSNIDSKIELLLFDLKNDPEEQINIVESDLTNRTYLLQNLKQFVENLPKYSKFTKSTVMDQETRQRLKALGYIN